MPEKKDRDFNYMGYRKTTSEGICCRVGIYFLKAIDKTDLFY
jgi:hypothetical protein